MITVQTIINLQIIIFDEKMWANFEWDLYQNSDLSIKLCKDTNQIFIIIKERKQPYELEQENIYQQSRLHFEKIMALLRMYKKGNVQANSFQIVIDSLPLEPRVFPYMISWGPTLFSFYALNILDKDMLGNFFNHFDELEIENTSLHWFSYAPFRPIIRDRLVDYVISIESMFIEYDTNGKKKSGKQETLKKKGKKYI